MPYHQAHTLRARVLVLAAILLLEGLTFALWVATGYPGFFVMSFFGLVLSSVQASAFPLYNVKARKTTQRAYKTEASYGRVKASR